MKIEKAITTDLPFFSNDKYLLGIKGSGRYARKGFWLNKSLDWTIIKAMDGSLTLVPRQRRGKHTKHSTNR